MVQLAPSKELMPSCAALPTALLRSSLPETVTPLPVEPMRPESPDQPTRLLLMVTLAASPVNCSKWPAERPVPGSAKTVAVVPSTFCSTSIPVALALRFSTRVP